MKKGEVIVIANDSIKELTTERLVLLKQYVGKDLTREEAKAQMDGVYMG